MLNQTETTTTACVCGTTTYKGFRMPYSDRDYNSYPQHYDRYQPQHAQRNRPGNGSRRRQQTSQTHHRSHSQYSGHRGGHNKRRRPPRRGYYDPRHNNNHTLQLIIIVALIILLLFAIGSCMRSVNMAQTRQDQQRQQEEEEQPKENPQDSRVAYGADENITNELSPVLDRSEKLQQIAQNATSYPDDRIIELAVNEPAAIDFVAQYPRANKDTSGYTGTVTQGTYPALYDWDASWGNMDYGDLPLGVSGSGPTALSIAYMGLTGNSDQTPATIANLALQNSMATGDSGTSADFFTQDIGDLGLTCTGIDANKESITKYLAANTPILAEVKADTLTTTAHWILATSADKNTGAVTVFDPTSTSVSSHAWDPGTIAASADIVFMVKQASADQATQGQSAQAAATNQQSTTTQGQSAKQGSAQ